MLGQIKIAFINRQIRIQHCQIIEEKIRDENLLDVYREASSVKSKIKKLKNVLKNNNIETTSIENIVNDYITELIPAGTKGVIRGNMFNKYIEDYILSLSELIDNNYEICFEKKHEKYETSEIPDWYIYDKLNDKILIGMNQLDLWSGGHQINRGTKYIYSNISNNAKLVCVVCSFIQLKKINNKVFKILYDGIINKRLCYKNGLKEIIYDYFNLKFY